MEPRAVVFSALGITALNGSRERKAVLSDKEAKDGEHDVKPTGSKHTRYSRFSGSLDARVTQDLGLDGLSFLTDYASPVGTSVSVLFYFSHNVAYMPLAGQVTAVTEESGDPTTQVRIDVCLLPLGDIERRILESTFHELEVYLLSLGAPESSARASARAELITTNPRLFFPCSSQIIRTIFRTDCRPASTKSLAV